MNATSVYGSEKNQELLQRKSQPLPQQTQSITAPLATQLMDDHNIPTNKFYPLNAKNKQQQQQQPPLLATLAKNIKSMMSPLNNWLQSTLDHYSPIEFTSTPSDFTTSPQQQPQPQPQQPIQAQGWKYPPSYEPSTSITVTSRPFNNYSLTIHNPHHLDFDYLAINGLPGLTRFSFNSGVKNIIYPQNHDFAAEEDNTTAFKVLKKSDNRPELWTNGEQYIIPCRYAHDSSLKLQGALSIYAREFQIGPINHDLILKRETIEIICDGVGLVSETIGATIGDYSYDTETILDPNYPLDKTFDELKLQQWEHFVTFYSIIHSTKTSQQLQTQGLEDPMTIQQQPIESQIYLDRFASFAMDPPIRTYKSLIAGIVGGSVALIICLLAILPIKRHCETKKDEKRQAAVKIEIGGVSNVPFEELGDDDVDDDDDGEGGYNNYVYH